VTAFASIFHELERQPKRSTVYGSGDQTAVEAQFRHHTVEVRHEQLPPGGPEPFLVIEENGYDGVWTNDPEIVQRLLAGLEHQG